MYNFENLGEHLLRPCLFEIDLDALRHNIDEIQKYVGESVKVFAVLKCNAYGFGLKETAQIVEETCAYAIAVADLAEAIYLRQAGISKPILVYSNNLPSAAPFYIDYNLIPTIDSLDYARAYSEASSDSLKVFVKVDTGRYRNGVLLNNVVSFCQKLSRFENLTIEGIYTHLDRLDIETDEAYVRWQFSKYTETIQALEENGIHIPIKIAASSAEVLQFPDMCLNAIDVGKIIYGIYFPRSAKNKMDLQPVFKSLKTRLIANKKVPLDHPFASNINFKLKDHMAIGVIPMGWGDGLPRTPLNEMEVLVNGKRVKVIGSIYVEHSRIDLTELPNAQVGDEVVIVGTQRGQDISFEEVADRCSMGGSELARTVREQIPRLYYKCGKPYKLKTILREKLYNLNVARKSA
ncbi:MAG: alanine racemase [Deltaproteobacteria bacterium]|nr:alanine racemase [Deltaproteobacteria bacterium]MBW2154498.1 alanine racemase [Deltaproteobacteria bacterium]